MSTDLLTPVDGRAVMVEADEGKFCPECGQSLHMRGSVAAPAGARRTAWSWVLVAAGVYLVVTFGPRVWDVYHTIAVTDRALLRQVDCSTERQGDGGCQLNVAGGTSRVLAMQVSRALAQRQLDRGLLATAVGLLAVLVGLHSLIRGRVPLDSRGWFQATVLGLWTTAENLFVALFSLALGGCCYLLVGELVAGRPLAWNVADQTVNRIMALIFDVAQIG